MNAWNRPFVRPRHPLLLRIAESAGNMAVGIILSSAVLLLIAQHAGNLRAAGDFACSMVGATLTLIAIEAFAHRLSRHG